MLQQQVYVINSLLMVIDAVDTRNLKRDNAQLKTRQLLPPRGMGAKIAPDSCIPIGVGICRLFRCLNQRFIQPIFDTIL